MRRSADDVPAYAAGSPARPAGGFGRGNVGYSPARASEGDATKAALSSNLDTFSKELKVLDLSSMLCTPCIARLAQNLSPREIVSEVTKLDTRSFRQASKMYNETVGNILTDQLLSPPGKLTYADRVRKVPKRSAALARMSALATLAQLLCTRVAGSPAQHITASFQSSVFLKRNPFCHEGIR